MSIDDTHVTTSSLGNHSGQWGLASILLSSLAIIMFPMMLSLLFASLVLMDWDEAHQSSDVDLGILAAQVLGIGLLGVAAFALLCGLIGLASALFRGQSFGLSLAGTVSSVLGVAAAGLLVLGGLRAIEWARDCQKTNYAPNGKKIPQSHQNMLQLLK